MFAELVSTENQCRILQEHFNLLYISLSGARLIPDANFAIINGLKRCLSGIPVPYHNAVIGAAENGNMDASIDEQLSYFNKAKMPFVWYLNEESDPEFKKKLIARGFQDAGIFRGVIGLLDRPIPTSKISDSYVLELVKDGATMDAFNDLVCSIFGIEGMSMDLYKKFLWSATKSSNQAQHKMFHWIAKKEGKAVSALSTLIEGEVVSFWNGASLIEMRRQGLSTALRCLALQDAIARGCRIGTSYLMSAGLAFGICNKLGYQTHWRFNVFLAPDIRETDTI